MANAESSLSEKIVYFIRHGSLPERASGRLIGQCAMPLSDEGRREAAACGRFLAKEHFDAVYAGTLLRVSQTLEECASAAGEAGAKWLASAVRDERLNEFDFGSWTERSVAGVSGTDAELYRQWNFGNYEFSFPCGETVAAFAARTRAVWRDICDSPGKRIAVFSHGGVIMSLLADIVGMDRKNAFHIWVARGSVARVRLTDPVNGRGRLMMIVRPLELFEDQNTPSSPSNCIR